MARIAVDESIVNKVRHKRGKGQTHSRGRSTDSNGKKPDGKPHRASHTQDKHANSVGKPMNLRENFALLWTKNATNVRKKDT